MTHLFSIIAVVRTREKFQLCSHGPTAAAQDPHLLQWPAASESSSATKAYPFFQVFCFHIDDVWIVVDGDDLRKVGGGGGLAVELRRA